MSDQQWITPDQWAQEFITEFKRLAGPKAHAEVSAHTYKPGRYPVVLPSHSGTVDKQTIAALMEVFDGALMVACGVPGATELVLVPTLDAAMDPIRDYAFARAWAKSQTKSLQANAERTFSEIMTKGKMTREEAEKLWSGT